MNFLQCNIDDEHSDEELEDMFAGVDEEMNDRIAANAPP